MREIRFRAWQKEPSLHRKRGMYLVDDIVFYNQDGGGEVFLHLPGEESKSSEYFDDVELMQYTGLRDKNGVEIYEGDIVQSYGQRGKVLWVHSGWEVGREGNSRFLASFHTAGCEVIGNIYENPELLTVGNGRTPRHADEH